MQLESRTLYGITAIRAANRPDFEDGYATTATRHYRSTLNAIGIEPENIYLDTNATQCCSITRQRGRWNVRSAPLGACTSATAPEIDGT
jgi:hypothetical protein